MPPRLLAAARAAGARSVVDSTFTTPLLMQPLALGADFVAHSATKYLGGHGDVLAGIVAAATEADALALRRVRQMLGANLSPFDAYLCLRGLRTLPLRVREQNANARGLAEWLAAQPRVDAGVLPRPARQRRLRAGAPASCRRVWPARCCRSICAAPAAPKRSPSWSGCASSSACPPWATSPPWPPTRPTPRTAASRPSSAPPSASATACVRLSAGIEALDDLLADLAQALG